MKSKQLRQPNDVEVCNVKLTYIAFFLNLMKLTNNYNYYFVVISIKFALKNIGDKIHRNF